MRIAQVAPLYECVPPKLYGGTERIVSYLTEELVRVCGPKPRVGLTSVIHRDRGVWPFVGV